MELRQYAMVVQRRLLVVVLAALIAGLAGYVATRGSKTIYTASAKLSAQQFVTTGATYHEDVYGSQQLALNDVVVATTYPVLAQAAALAPPDVGGADALGSRVQAVVVPNTAVFEIRATSPRRDVAIRSANAVAQAFVAWTTATDLARYSHARTGLSQELATAATQIDALQRKVNSLEIGRLTARRVARLSDLQNQLAQARAQYTILQNTLQQTIMGQAQSGATVLLTDPARPATTAVSRPNKKLLILLATLGGLVLGLVIAFLLQYVSDTVGSQAGVEDGSMPARLGSVAAFEPQTIGPLVSVTDDRAPAAEDYRRLGAHVRSLCNGSTKAKTVLVTSPHSHDGKTTTVANVAIALAQAGKSVIAVDANFLNPHLHTVFAVGNEKGMLNALSNGATIDDGYLQPTIVDGLRVLTAGTPRTNAADLVASPKLAQLVCNLRREADVVLIDSPALLAAADAALLATSVDDTIIVVDARHTTMRALNAAQVVLDRVGACARGIVLNKVTDQYDV